MKQRIAYVFALCCIAYAMSGCADNAVTGTLSYRDPGSGAKAGLVFVPGQKPVVSVKVPYYGPNGEILGMLDVGTAPPVVTPPVVTPDK